MSSFDAFCNAFSVSFYCYFNNDVICSLSLVTFSNDQNESSTIFFWLMISRFWDSICAQRPLIYSWSFISTKVLASSISAYLIYFENKMTSFTFDHNCNTSSLLFYQISSIACLNSLTLSLKCFNSCIICFKDVINFDRFLFESIFNVSNYIKSFEFSLWIYPKFASFYSFACFNESINCCKLIKSSSMLLFFHYSEFNLVVSWCFSS